MIYLAAQHRADIVFYSEEIILPVLYGLEHRGFPKIIVVIPPLSLNVLLELLEKPLFLVLAELIFG